AGGHDGRGGPVADAAGGAGVNDAVFLEGAGQLLEGFGVRVGARVLVFVEERDALLGLDLDGGELLREAPALLRRGPALLTRDRELVDLLLRDLVLDGEVL